MKKAGYIGQGHGSDGVGPTQNTTECLDQQSQISSPLVISVKQLGKVCSTTTFVKRDLGFQGKFGCDIILTYGDTIYSDREYSDEWRGMSCNSVAIATKYPDCVMDFHLNNDGFPACFLLPNKDWGEDPTSYSLGLTNVVEIQPGLGILFFLLNHRPGGVNNILGAGIAMVAAGFHPTSPPFTATRVERYWWDGDTEPWYGDICAFLHPATDYVYAYGHKKDNPWVYLTRVKRTSALCLDEYEYWNGTGWQMERLRGGDVGEKESVFWQINQGQVFWSEYFNRLAFVYCDNFWSCQLLIRFASEPEGPWTDPVTLYKPTPIVENGNIYAAVPHPYFDLSGKSLVVTFTNHPNTVQAVRIYFK